MRNAWRYETWDGLPALKKEWEEIAGEQIIIKYVPHIQGGRVYGICSEEGIKRIQASYKHDECFTVSQCKDNPNIGKWIISFFRPKYPTYYR
jgi:hypothetical protein